MTELRDVHKQYGVEFGQPNVDGNWRIIPVGQEMIIEFYTQGAWVRKFTTAQTEGGEKGISIYAQGEDYEVGDFVIDSNNIIYTAINPVTNAPSVIDLNDWEPISSSGGGGGANTILNGSGVPPNGFGENGDFYIDTLNDDIYGPKTGGLWGAPTSLIGADGQDGTDGTDGNTILSGTTTPSGSTGNDGDFYIELDQSLLYGPKSGGSWPPPVSLIGAQGEDGADGEAILNGMGAPTTEGSEGDFYLDTSTYILYGPKTGGSWGMGVSLIGANGTNGTDGTDGKSVLNGVGVPSNGIGVDGEFYIDTAAEEIYGPKTGGLWGSGTSLVGSDGTDGTDGIDGNTILSGTSVPTNGDGNDGDIYIKTDTSDLYGPKSGGTWGAPTSLIGAAGSDGTDGTDGIDGNTILSGTTVPANGVGNDGDIYIKTDTSDLYGPKSGGTWGTPTSLLGQDGSDGADGNTILSGTSAPANGLGNDGDIYIKTDTSDLYGPKSGGTWGLPTSLIGQDGSDGTDGTDGIDGNTILSGIAVPSNGIGNDGDIYIKTDTSDLYGPKTGGSWGAPTSLIGQDGTSILNGTAVPTTEGNDGDFYIKTDTSDLYGPKTAGFWGFPVSLIGADGADGQDGAQGVAGQDGNTIISGVGAPTTQGTDGDYYIDIFNNDIYGPKAGGLWGAPTSLVGPAGADGQDGTDGTNGTNGTDGVDGQDGNTIISGVGAPLDGIGNDGDYYIDISATEMYGPKIGGTWFGTPIQLQGQDGADGQDGNTILNGISAPNDSFDGVDGDFYIDTFNNDIYGPKSGGTWGAPTSIIGAQGVAGNDGADGTDGKTILNGTSIPLLEGVDGDFYIRTDTSEIYGPKSGGLWGAPTSLVGADGTDGTDGTNGTDGQDGSTILNGIGAPNGGLGNDGDFYIDTFNNDIYGPKAIGSWGSPTSIIGAAGADGDDGNTILNGVGIPSNGLGVDGDFYIDTFNNNIYGPKTTGLWGAATSIVGADGQDGTDGTNGTDGADGKTVLNGTAVPTTEGVDGDFYIKTDTSDIYGPKTGGSWGAPTSLVGAQGEKGDAGEGLPAGGTAGQIPVKIDSTDYNTQWVDLATPSVQFSKNGDQSITTTESPIIDMATPSIIDSSDFSVNTTTGEVTLINGGKYEINVGIDTQQASNANRAATLSILDSSDTLLYSRTQYVARSSLDGSISISGFQILATAGLVINFAISANGNGMVIKSGESHFTIKRIG